MQGGLEFLRFLHSKSTAFEASPENVFPTLETVETHTRHLEMISTKRRIEYALGYLILGMKADARSELDHIPFDERNEEVQLLRSELEARTSRSRSNRSSGLPPASIANYHRASSNRSRS